MTFPHSFFYSINKLLTLVKEALLIVKMTSDKRNNKHTVKSLDFLGGSFEVLKSVTLAFFDLLLSQLSSTLSSGVVAGVVSVTSPLIPLLWCEESIELPLVGGKLLLRPSRCG